MFKRLMHKVIYWFGNNYLLRKIKLYKITGLKSLYFQKKRFFGEPHAGFIINPKYVNKNSIIYAFGIGENISFELQLIKEFGCKTVSFDPTQRSLKWLKTQNLPSEFSYYEIGLSNKDGELTFEAPKQENWVSFTSVPGNGDTKEKISLPVKKLSTIMKELGDSHIDILKMDIEGSEYDVIDDIIEYDIPIKQLVVEFHYRFVGIGLEKNKRTFKKLMDNGYKCFAVSENFEEFSFIHK